MVASILQISFVHKVSIYIFSQLFQKNDIMSSVFTKTPEIVYMKNVIFVHLLDTRPGLLEAWLVLTSVKYHGNL